MIGWFNVSEYVGRMLDATTICRRVVRLLFLLPNICANFRTTPAALALRVTNFSIINLNKELRPHVVNQDKPLRQNCEAST